MSEAGTQNPCAGHSNEESDPPFFTYEVHGQPASVWWSGGTLGGTPNPVQSLLPTGILPGSDFLPYNTGGTNKDLWETVQKMESSIAPGFGGAIPGGVTAYTTYPNGASPNRITFTYGGVNPVVGDTFQQVLAVVSHKEGDGPGDAPNQDQWLSITTRDAPGGPLINCTPGTTRYVVPDAKATGGPAWPIPPYQVIDVTYQRAAGGLNNWGTTSSTPCLNTRTRVENAEITYNAVCTAANCAALRDYLDSVTLCICLRSMPSQAVSSPVCQSPSDSQAFWVVNGGNLSQKDCTQGRNPTAVGQPAPPPYVGIFQPNDPMLVGRVTCGPTECVGQTHTLFFKSDLGVSKSLTLTGWNWPAIGPVTYVTLRVSHREQAPNLVPRVSISFPGSACPDPIEIPVSTNGYTEYAQFLPAGCAPSGADGLVLTYTVTCSPSHGGVNYSGCNTGQATNTYAFLDAITLDLEYELGGEGGTPIATFVARSGGTTVTANATFGDGTSVSDYRVS